MKVWLDTDIGSDIDDALALAYLLCEPTIELIGISTVTEVDLQRAKLCSALCRIANEDVPIVAGVHSPLLVAPRQTQVPQAHALANWAHDGTFFDFDALKLLSLAARRNPGEITLLTIGPLTNIAIAFATDPELPSLLKEIVSMIGAFHRRGLEWNAMLDPHAAEMVYRAPVARSRSVGLDVTLQVALPHSEVTKRLSETEIGRCVADMAGAWKSDRITFHDPLAAVDLVQPVIRYDRGQVAVETELSRQLGFTYFDTRAEGRHEVGREVDVDRFFSIYFDSLRDFTTSG